MNVREVFNKAFGEVPEGATCHVGNWSTESCDSEPTIALPTVIGDRCYIWREFWTAMFGGLAFGPDISDRPAESFRGFFGDAYDAVLDGAK